MIRRSESNGCALVKSRVRTGEHRILRRRVLAHVAIGVDEARKQREALVDGHRLRPPGESLGVGGSAEPVDLDELSQRCRAATGESQPVPGQ